MTSLGICLLACAITYWAGKRSLGQGLISLLFWGYFFGIIRANLLATFTFFVFDAALLGFYLSQKGLLSGEQRSSALRGWAWVLMLWPAVLMFMPFQPFLVSLVGLRGAILFIPMMLAGSRLRGNDLRELTFGLAALNLIALGFAGAEYFMGLERFFPINAATQIIYGSVDVAGGFNRIPSTFGTAHLFGGTMATSAPYLIAGWEYAQTRKTRWFIMLGVGAAFLGVLLSATRLNFVICAGLSLVTAVNGRMTPRKRLVIALLVVVMAGVALRNTRFQRFKSLSDTDFVQERISGSVNRTFFEILLDYPMGNGLGGGGTNIPYFLAGQVRNPIGLENEYARILSEQGIIGLALWLGFLTWFLTRFNRVFAKGPWATGRRLVWCVSVFVLGTGAIGTGMLTSVPETAILLLSIGWTATSMRDEARGRRPARIAAAGLEPRLHRPLASLESSLSPLR
jgi:hypothetical protein